MNDILNARELRKIQIVNLLEIYQVVICLKVNMVGSDKNNYLAKIIFNKFSNDLESFKFDQKYCFHSVDGDYNLYTIKESSKNIKELMIKYEESELGKYIDIDVYYDSNGKHRNGLRKCWICDNHAFVCARNKTHSQEELINKMKTDISLFFGEKIEKLALSSILMELNIDNKFGLVGPSSNGSHPDMNYEMMKLSAEVISVYFSKMFINSFLGNNLEVIIKNMKEIGIEAERKMLLVTNNINTYKGLIFDLGVIVSAMGLAFKENSFESIFMNAKKLTENVFSNLNEVETFGSKAYKEYGFGGARKEAYLGFPTVQRVLNKITSFDENCIVQTLCDIIIQCEDTTLLKRAGSISKYQQYKNELQGLKIVKEIKEKINKKWIKNNLSCGGSADLLIVTVFLKKVKDEKWYA